MKIVEFMKRPVSRIEYYAPIMVGMIVSVVYGIYEVNKINKFLKENENGFETENKKEDEA